MFSLLFYAHIKLFLERIKFLAIIMTCLQLTETAIIAILGMIFGFGISCCRQIEQSRCKDISFCYGLVKCDRDPLNESTILEMEQQTEEKTNQSS